MKRTFYTGISTFPGIIANDSSKKTLLSREISLQTRHYKIEEDTDPLRQSRAAKKYGVYFLYVILHRLGQNLYQCARREVVPRVIIADTSEPQPRDRHAPDRLPIIGQQ